MSTKKVIAFLAACALATCLLTGCSSRTLGYRKYPSVSINPSAMGSLIQIRLPLDEKEYIYSTYDCEYTEDGLDLTIHFTTYGAK